MNKPGLLFFAVLSLVAAVAAADGIHLDLSRATLTDERAGVTWDLGKAASAKLAAGGRGVVIEQTPPEKDSIKLLDGALGIAAAEGGYALVP
ncbi:MAG: hypothetical protein N2689_01300, partial [Verrucomicrobiae bacterium]|nr:hypothetical protein [Verrucomicrobiae bacterium]